MRLAILNFHGIGMPPARIPPDEVPYWVTRDAFAAIVAQAAASPWRERVRFTFDDGNASDLEIAAPLLAEAGFGAEFFVLTGRIGAPGYLDRAGIRALLDMGMAIGLHGRDHVDWRRCDPATLQEEVPRARAALARTTGRAIETVGVPFGGYDRRVIARLVAEQFRVIYTSDGGTASDRARIRARTSIRSDMTPGAIDSLIRGRDPLRRRLRRTISTTLRRHVL